MGKNASKAYIPENLEYFARSLIRIRGTLENGGFNAIDLNGLQRAVIQLPRQDRKNIEHFWGLTGGINHSKKSSTISSNDIAFVRMRNEAADSLNKLFRLDSLYLYDKKLMNLVEQLAKKIDKCNINISDIDAIKYLLAFLVFLQNGPKLPFENDSMSIDTKINGDFIFDEYSIIKNSLDEFQDLPDGSINLKLIQYMLDMLDIRDKIIIKKCFCIKISKEEIPEGFDVIDIEPIYTLTEIRNFKERVFSYGNWVVSDNLVFNDSVTRNMLEAFMNHLNVIRKDWSKIAEFKIAQTLLRTPHELRALDVYDIGGLRFTDIYEVMFLYIARNII